MQLVERGEAFQALPGRLDTELGAQLAQRVAPHGLVRLGDRISNGMVYC
jgi:hypothetical protein